MSEVKNGRYEINCEVWFFKDGEIHHEEEPAIQHKTGYKAWYLNGQRHREDGPAIEWPNGDRQWFLNNSELTEEKFNQWLEMKALNEKLESTFEPKPKERTKKI